MTYKCKGLEFYVTGCRNILHAVSSFLYYRIGVTENNIELFEGEIPEGANVIEAC